jgi:hypothetical protein
MDHEEMGKRLIEQFERGRREYEARMKQTIKAKLKICLEGFQSKEDEIAISNDLHIRRAPLHEREEFFKKAEDLNMTRYNSENNEFFLSFDFEMLKGEIQSLTPGNKLSVISIFFAVCSKAFIRIDKGQLLVNKDDNLISAGLYKTPFRSLRFERNVDFLREDINQLKTLWPLFSNEFSKSAHFSLVARRYYYSLTRHQWEDELIDLIIALEALLLPEDIDGKGGLIAKRLSKLLMNEFQPGTVSKITRRCYEIRNEVVHGDVLNGLEIEARSLLHELSTYVKASLHLYLLEFGSLSTVDFVKKIDTIILKAGKRNDSEIPTL